MIKAAHEDIVDLQEKNKKLSIDLDNKTKESQLAWEVINKVKTELTSAKNEIEVYRKVVKEFLHEASIESVLFSR